MASDLDFKVDDTPRFRNFDWEKTKTFYYVAKFGSFANAARFLNISQSALSRQILYLEHHLGCPLFLRHSGGVHLTRKGEELFAIAEATYFGLKGFTQNTHANSTAGGRRKIRIVTTHEIASFVLDEHLFAYNKINPNIMFELIQDDHVIDVALHDVDIAIRPFDPHCRGIQQEFFLLFEKKLYASKEYLEIHGEPKTVEDLKYHAIIAPAKPEVYPYSDLTWILRLGLPQGKFHEPVFTSTSLENLVKAAQKGLGIVGGYQQMDIIKNSELINILPQIVKQDVEFITFPNYLQKDPQIIDLVEFIKKQVNENT